MNARRVAEQGEWPDYIDPQQSLLSRIPSQDKPATGFDAGIGCALDLIPRNKQKLASQLHAAYTPEAISQVIEQTNDLQADDPAAWWLSACSICSEGRLTEDQFNDQLTRFKKLAINPLQRLASANQEYKRMISLFEIRDSVPFSTVDGGMQGAYLKGHLLAVSYAEQEDLYFIGTFKESLGLEKFIFSDKLDDLGRLRSGPVHGSKQFVKCTDKQELQAALQTIREKTDLLN
jgi:hypothetical protein